jgi:hypothetical protein
LDLFSLSLSSILFPFLFFSASSLYFRILKIFEEKTNFKFSLDGMEVATP